ERAFQLTSLWRILDRMPALFVGFQDCRLVKPQENSGLSSTAGLSQMGHRKMGRFGTAFFGFTAYVAEAPPPPPAWIFPTTAIGGTPLVAPHRFPSAPGLLWRSIHTGCRRRGCHPPSHRGPHSRRPCWSQYCRDPAKPGRGGPGHRRGGTPARRG